MKKLLNELISLSVYIDKKLERLSIIGWVIEIINVLFLLLKLLQKYILPQLPSHIASTLNLFYNAAAGLDANGHAIQQFGYVMSSILILLCGSFIYYLHIGFQTIGKVNKTKLSLLLLHYPLTVFIIIEFFYSSCVMYLVTCFSKLHQSPVHFYFWTILSASLVLIVTLYNSKSRLFSILLPIIIILIQTLDILPTSLFILICSTFFVYTEKQLINRCSYVFFIVVSLFNIIQELDNNLQLSNLIWLGVCLLLTGTSVVIKSIDNYDMSDEKEINNYLAKCIARLKNKQLRSLGTRELIRLEMIFRNLYQKYYLELQDKKEITSKQIAQLSYDQLIELVDFKFCMASEKSPNDFEMKKHSLLFRIQNFYKFQESMNQINQFMGHDTRESSNLSRQQKYARKSVELAVLQGFMTKQLGHEKIKQMKQLSSIQQKFIDQAVKLVVVIGVFWDSISMDFLIEEMIEENFYQIIFGLEKAKKLINQLQKGYKAIEQIKFFRTVAKLAQPNQAQATSLNPESHQAKSDSLYYFAIRNHRIVEISSPFLKILNSTHFQIIGSPISGILPEEIVNNLKEQEFDAVSSTTMNVIPIIYGNYFIKVFEANVKLEPKPNAGIELFYFLENVEKEEKRAYLYVNCTDMNIFYISQQLFELLGVSHKEVSKKMEKRGLFLGDIVINVDRSLIISELERKKTMKCQFSTQRLTSNSQVGKPKKFNGITRLENKYQNYFLLSIHIITPGEVTNNKLFKSRKNVVLKTGILRNQTSEDNILLKPTDIKARAMKNMKQKANGQLDPSNWNQATFCPIQNPYKHKIYEKQSEISEQSTVFSFTYTNCAIILSVTLLVTLMFAGVLLMVYCNQQNNVVGEVIDNFQKVSKHINSLIHATYEVYTQYLLSSQKQVLQAHIKTFNPEITVEEYLSQGYNKVHLILKQFQESYTGFYNKDIFEGVRYKFVYSYFTQNTDLSKKSLIQFIYNIKMASERIKISFQQSQKLSTNFNNFTTFSEHPLQYLKDNYPRISALQAPFDSIQTLISLYFQQLNPYLVVILIACVAGVLVFYYIIYAIKKNLEIIKEIFHIFGQVSKAQVENRYQQIQSSIKRHVDCIPKDSFKKLADLNKAKQRTMIFYNQKARQQSLQQQSIMKNQQKEGNELLQNKVILSNKNRPYFRALSKMKGIIIITIAFVLTLGGFFYKINFDLQQDRFHLEFYSQIQKLVYAQLKYSADMFHSNMMVSVFNQSETNLPEIRQIKSSVAKLGSEKFYDSFGQFYQQQIEILKKNLCQVEIGETFLSEFVKCQDVGLGILSKGYIQTSEYYDSKTEVMKHNYASLTEISKSQKYMNLFIHIYIRQKLLKQLNEFRVNAGQNRQKLQLKYQQNLVCFGIILSVLASVFVAYLLLQFVPMLKRIQKTGIGYFKILPTQVLSKIDISAYINSKDLLNRLSWL